MNLIEEKVGIVLSSLAQGMTFWTELSKKLRTINKWDLTELKICMVNNTIIWTKWQGTEWEKIFTDYTFNRGLTSKLCEELRKVMYIKETWQFKNGGTKLCNEFSSNETQMAKKQLKESQTSLVIILIQKIILTSNHTQVRMTKVIETSDTTNWQWYR